MTRLFSAAPAAALLSLSMSLAVPGQAFAQTSSYGPGAAAQAEAASYFFQTTQRNPKKSRPEDRPLIIRHSWLSRPALFLSSPLT